MKFTEKHTYCDTYKKLQPVRRTYNKRTVRRLPHGSFIMFWLSTGRLFEKVWNLFKDLLEPFDKITVNVSNDYLGAVLSDLSKRRGKIQSSEEDAYGNLDVVALVPEAEIQEYANELKAITKSTAFFNLEFYDYEKVPDLLAQKIIEENKK